MTALPITEPGVYDLPAATYHSDPVAGGSLSSTGARRLLPPGCPALFDHERRNPPRKAAWDFGKAAHRRVLGAGEDVVVVDADGWRTKAAREQRDEAYAAGLTPILAADNEVVEAMAAALRAHPLAASLLRPGTGLPEQTLVWQDADTGVWCRALVDWLPHHAPGRRLIVVDYKTCVSAAPDDLQRAIYDHGYYLQADWYLSGVRALKLGDDPQFLLLCQMKTEPYLVTVAQPDREAIRIAAHLNRLARITYRECVESGRWPGWTDDVALVSLPGWVEARYKELDR